MRNKRTLEWAEACELLGTEADSIVNEMYQTAWQRERRERGREAALWAAWWVLSFPLLIGGAPDGWKVVGAVIAVIAGGALGRSLMGLLPVKVDLVRVFEFGPGSASFWARLEPRYHRRGFVELCREHGASVLVPNNDEILGEVLARRGALVGAMPARLLQREDFLRAGLRRYVHDRTGGAIEMACTLATAPKVRSVDDVIGLVARMSRKHPTYGHERDHGGTVAQRRNTNPHA